MLEESVTKPKSPASASGASQSTAAIWRDEAPIIIAPSKPWMPVRFGEFWAYRELLYFLIWRDLKVRYKQTVLGVVWVVTQPLLMTIIFTIFLGKLVRVPSDGMPYALFVYSGLMPWTFFSNAIMNSSNSLVGNANLITKVYFPRTIIPAAAVGARLVDFGVAFVIMGGLMVYYRIPLGWNLLAIPVFILLIALLSVGFGFWASALNVKYRDVGIVLPVLVQLWMFVSPVAYPASIVPQRWRLLYSLNPMTGIIQGLRSSLFNGPFNWSEIAIATVFIFGLLVYSLYAFKHMEKHFADLV